MIDVNCISCKRPSSGDNPLTDIILLRIPPLRSLFPSFSFRLSSTLPSFSSTPKHALLLCGRLWLRLLHHFRASPANFTSAPLVIPPSSPVSAQSGGRRNKNRNYCEWKCWRRWSSKDGLCKSKLIVPTSPTGWAVVEGHLFVFALPSFILLQTLPARPAAPRSDLTRKWSSFCPKVCSSVAFPAPVESSSSYSSSSGASINDVRTEGVKKYPKLGDKPRVSFCKQRGEGGSRKPTSYMKAPLLLVWPQLLRWQRTPRGLSNWCPC